MNCTEARQYWMLFLDSEGDPELHLHIRDHLAKCSACTRWFGSPTRLRFSALLFRKMLRGIGEVDRIHCQKPRWRGRSLALMANTSRTCHA